MKRRDIIIVTVSVIAALFCICLTFWGNLKNNGTLSTDAFVGFMSTLIGICTTIIVGFQIASYLELRETRKQVEDLEKERLRLEEICIDINEVRKDLANAFVAIHETTDNPLLKAVVSIMAICVDNKSSNSEKILLARYDALDEALAGIPINDDSLKMLAAFNNKLRNVSYNGVQIGENVKIAHFKIVSRIDGLTNANEKDRK